MYKSEMLTTILPVALLLTCLVEGSPRGEEGQKAYELNNPVSSYSFQRTPAIQESPKEVLLKRQKQKNFKSDGGVYLRIKTHMKSRNLTSGEDVQFKCKVEGRPLTNIEYTCRFDDAKQQNDYRYHNNVKVSTNRDRFHISERSWGSKLHIKPLYTLDSGSYRCEASNGLRRVHTSASLHVSFKRPPAPSFVDNTKIDLPSGRCEVYSGESCQEYLDGINIFVDGLEDQSAMEAAMRRAIRATHSFSNQCQQYALPAFCYYIFPPCHVDENGDIQRGNRLCREDCERLKSDVCKGEYLDNSFMKNISDAVDCTFLESRVTASCTRLNWLSDVEEPLDCYNDEGEDYLGNVNVAESGIVCKGWPSQLVKNDPELLRGHNYCRNPDGRKDKPWCFTDDEGLQSTPCQIKACEVARDSKTFIIVITSCAAAFILLVGFLLYFCRRRRSVNNNPHLSRDFVVNPVKEKLLLSAQQKIPELYSSSVRILTEIGKGKFGPVYKGSIVGDPRFVNKQTCAIVTCDDKAIAHRMELFQNEVEVIADLYHQNVASLKACVFQPNLHCMIFEYTDQVDLREHLLLNAPSTGFSKSAFSSSGKSSYILDIVDFMEMAVQISSGLEYLSKKNFIHRDIAARNILVCGNMELKIFNFGVIKDSYLSSYYKTEEGELLPIRWMSPESIQNWKFSDKSTVWSFGVLLWEMFSYGLQPYCGFGNHEVLEMISRRQLLPCPDQCPAKMYSLMQECWFSIPKQRPQFHEIRERLGSWMEVGEVQIVRRSHMNSLPNAFVNPSPPPDYRSHDEGSSSFWNGNCTSERSHAVSTSILPFDVRATEHLHQNRQDDSDRYMFSACNAT